MAIQQFDLLKKSAVTQIQSDLENAVEADRLLAQQAAKDSEDARDLSQTAQGLSEDARDKAEQWAENPENVEVEPGKYSALHHAAKAEDSKDLAEKWAEEDEDVEVETGKYSSKHWAAKADETVTGKEEIANKQNSLAADGTGTKYPTVDAVNEGLALKADAVDVMQNKQSIATLESILSDVNINQEAQVTASGVDTVALPKTAANTGMKVQLFGQSAQNLVVNGDFRNGINGYNSVSSSQSASNGIYSNIGAGVSAVPRSTTQVSILNGNKFYLKHKIRVTNAICTSLSIGTTANEHLFFSKSSPIQNTWYEGSTLTTSSVDSSVLRIGHSYADAASSLNSVMEIDYLMLINLTATFGAGNEPTKEQCDKLFSNYFEGVANTIGTGRLRSVGKNLFDKDRSSYAYGYYYSTGVFVPDTANKFNISIRNNIKVAPSTLYRYLYPVGIVAARCIGYDKDGVFISEVFQDGANSGSFTTPVNCEYIRIGFKRISGLTIDEVQTKGMHLQRTSVAPTAIEPYTESNLYFNGGTLRSNGLIKDEIRKGSNGYELVKRVGVGTLGSELVTGGDFEGGLIGALVSGDETSSWVLNETNPISGGKDGLLSVTVAGTLPSRPYVRPADILGVTGKVYQLSFKYKVNSGTAYFDSFHNGYAQKPVGLTLTGSGTFSTLFVCAGQGAFIGLIYISGMNIFSVQLDDISIKPVEGDLSASLSSTFTQIGNNIHYTLGTPVITPIAHAGLLNSNSNGTVYFEPAVADAGVYGSNIAIQLTDFPISTIESISKYEDGVFIPLNPATAVIASGGLSFTHPDLASGDLVTFTYLYNLESTGRSMTLTHYDSRYVVKDTENTNVYKITPKITSGVLTWELTLV